jgi:hypothetical protein
VSGGYVGVRRAWKPGDTVEVSLPKRLHLAPLPDNPQRAAVMWGPLVLAGEVPESAQDPGGNSRDLRAIPVLVAAGRPVGDWLKPLAGQPGRFRSEGVGREREVELLPFYQLHRRRYAAYWDFHTPESWAAKSAEIARERERLRRLEAATVAYAQPGEMQPERDFRMQGEETRPDRVAGRACRRGSKWFSFELPVEADKPMALIVTYIRDEWRRRTFDILVDGARLAEQALEARGPQEFFDVEYPLPADMVRGKERVTVRFEATGGNEIGAVFGLRMIRAGAR